jgi:hypothetical protein
VGWGMIIAIFLFILVVEKYKIAMEAAIGDSLKANEKNKHLQMCAIFGSRFAMS